MVSDKQEFLISDISVRATRIKWPQYINDRLVGGGCNSFLNFVPKVLCTVYAYLCPQKIINVIIYNDYRTSLRKIGKKSLNLDFNKLNFNVGSLVHFLKNPPPFHLRCHGPREALPRRRGAPEQVLGTTTAPKRAPRKSKWDDRGSGGREDEGRMLPPYLDRRIILWLGARWFLNQSL